MGFMDRIRQQQTQQQPSLSDAMRIAQGMGDPVQAICDIANKGGTISVPGSGQMPIADFVRMATEKGPQETLRMFGLDINNL